MKGRDVATRQPTLFDEPPKPPRDLAANRHGGNPESEAAWRREQLHLNHDQALVLNAVRAAGKQGITCPEFAASQGKGANHYSARFTELSGDLGLIRRNGERRKGAAVWITVEL